jgi:high-affinity iron transporter
MKLALRISILAAAAFVTSMLIWQGVTAQGAPDPLQPNTSSTVAFLDIGVLVFREGLECILVLAAITASMTGTKRGHRRPVALGATFAFVATLITWFIAVRIVGSLSDNMSALDLQAATGLLAIVVLLVIMNWFFHKIYWGGWIRAHNRRRKALLENARTAEISQKRLWWGLILLGFTSLYREGFEVVLFLQSYHLRLGGGVVLKGALLGLVLTGMVAVLTFVLQQRLPYRKMLITTGILLGVVLLVMVGEQAQEMQLAQWIHTTPIAFLEPYIPRWMGLWFAVFPTVETLVAQLIAAVLVIGSYFAARRFGGGQRGGAAVEAHAPSMAAINA